MQPDSLDVSARLICKLDSLTPLAEAERNALGTLSISVRSFEKYRTLVREGEAPKECFLMLDGFACRHKMTSHGQRQIVAISSGDDFLNLDQLLLPRSDYNVQLIAGATFAAVNMKAFASVVRQFPAIMEALWRDTLIDASLSREWLLNVGRRDARARVAQIICFVAQRSVEATFGLSRKFDLPFSQEQIADVAGLTPIHVNRMLRELSAEGLIVRDKRQVVIPNWVSLCRIADLNEANY